MQTTNDNHTRANNHVHVQPHTCTCNYKQPTTHNINTNKPITINIYLSPSIDFVTMCLIVFIHKNTYQWVGNLRRIISIGFA